MARRVSSPHLVGRVEELARLEAALERARAGSPAVVLVAGEAGVGKSRLITEFAARATSSGARMLTGGCVAFSGGELAYAPLIEALRDLTRQLEPAALAALLADGHGALTRLLPELDKPDSPAALTPAGEYGQDRLFGQLRRLLAQHAGDTPVVLVVEDLHWADRSTLQFLAYLIPSLRGERLLLVLSYRSDELPRTNPIHGWVLEQYRSDRVEQLELERLSRAELAEQLIGILGGPAPELVQEIFVRSQGNPFFAEELAASSVQGAPAALPGRLRDALLLRVGACSPTAQTVVWAAAVAGRRVDERLLAAVVALSHVDLLAGLREAVDQHLLVVGFGEDTYTFRHALVQEAVYSQLLPGERGLLHAALARTLAGLLRAGELDQPGSAAEVAIHWSRAHDVANTLTWSVRAAVEADELHAHAEALRHYERALELWDRAPDPAERAGMDRVEALQRAALAANIIGDDTAPALIDRALGEVDPAVEPVRAALLYERRGLYLGMSGDLQARFDALEEAVRLVAADPSSPARAQVWASYGDALVLAGREEEAAAAGEEALRTARELGAEGEAARALIVVGAAQAARGAFEAGIASLREACRLAEQQRIPDTLTRAYGWLGEALMQAGRLEDAVALSLAGREPLRRLGLAGRPYENAVLTNAAEALFKLGRWDDADPLATQALAQARPNSPNATLIVAMLEIGRGDFHAADARLEAVKDQSLGKVPEAVRVYSELVAELRCWQGRLHEAQAAVDDGLDRLTETGERVRSGRLFCLGVRIQADRAELGRARRDQRDVEAAVHATEALAARAAATTPNPLVNGVTPVLASGAVAAVWEGERARLAGRSDPAPWQSASAAWAALRRPYPVAYAQWREAEALVGRREPARRAAVPLRAAHATARRLRARPLLHELERLARRARIALDVPAVEAATPAPFERLGLTARELEVLRCVAAGQSNREIGEALFISTKTASIHVSHILRKLAVDSRVQAATIAYRLGVINEDLPTPERPADGGQKG
jgi:DNA-binding CsgD family transcriptional regulator